MKFLELVISCAYAITACLAAYHDDELLEDDKVKRVVCNSEVCQHRAQLILASVNQSADPCEDFYEYVCKRWADAHPVPEDEHVLDNFEIMTQDILKDVKGLLEAIPNTTHARSLTGKLGIAYRACKISTIQNDREKGLKIIRRLLAKSGLDMWPLIGNATGYPFKDSVEVLNLTTGWTLIFSIGIVKDMSDGRSKIIQLQLTTEALREDTKKQESEKDSDTLDKDTDDLKKFVSLFRPNATDAELTSFATDSLLFRSALAKLAQPLAQRRKVSQHWAKRTIVEVEDYLGGFPLLELLNIVFNEANVTLHGSDKIVITSVDYINRTLQFIKETDPVILYNYVGTKIARELAVLTWVPEGKPLGSNKNDSENPDDDDVSRTCLQVLHASMPELLIRLYLQHKFPDETKAEVETLLSNVERTYHATIRTAPWMDIVTRRRAIHKLLKMTKSVGYSGFNISEEALNKHFDQVGEITTNDSFAEITEKFAKNAYIKRLASLRDDSPLWLPKGGPEVNAFNLISLNEIIISAGILQGAFFQPGLPSFINLGGIGAVVGHEFSHAYDDEGSEYDANGRVVNWWTNYTRTEYEEKQKCFTKQYASIVDPVVNMSLNGVTTLGENIADNAGLRVAYRTHQSTVADFEEVTLPGLENFTRDQLFFISYALAWCESAAPSHNINKITGHVHSPNKYRVNVPLRNLEQFSAAFGCKKGSGMRLPHAERCLLW